MYGLSLTANLLCASATLLLASKIRRAMSSGIGGDGDAARAWGRGGFAVEEAADLALEVGELAGDGEVVEGHVASRTENLLL